MDEGTPVGTRAIAGVTHDRSPLSVEDTVDALTELIGEMGAKVFAVVDHSGEAQLADLSLRDTKLVIFGSPKAGTPLMQEAPLVALALPLKMLVWADDVGAVWMTHLTGDWLTGRYGLARDEARPLSAPAALAARAQAAPNSP